MELSYQATMDRMSPPSGNAKTVQSKNEITSNEENDDDEQNMEDDDDEQDKEEYDDEQGEEEDDGEQSDVEVTLMSRPTSNATWIAAIRKDIQSLLKHYRQRVLHKL